MKLQRTSHSDLRPNAPRSQSRRASLFAQLARAGGIWATFACTLLNAQSISAVPAPHETRQHRIPFTQVDRTSPLDGESAVALTRETVLYFDAPLDVASVDSAAISAVFGSQPLDPSIHVSNDGTRVTLFYDPQLPAAALVRVTVFGDLLSDTLGRAVDADGDGDAGGSREIEFVTLSNAPVPDTSVCGRVFASELDTSEQRGPVNTPLEGVTISVDGASPPITTVTDSMGNFCLQGTPGGKFFVHVDGTTALGTPASAYYPSVGKAWQPTPGQSINVGDIFLPLVPNDALVAVSDSVDTAIGFSQTTLATTGLPASFALTQITVPAGSLFANNGTLGGSVGIAPVNPDRLPGELPAELAFPLVVTVLTDGATNFDTPAPITFPNLPDPDTGVALAPGAKSALFSFDHDAGRWAVVGPMTVSADGLTVSSDAGFGILAPGWHGVSPGSGPGATGARGPCQGIDGGSCALAAASGAGECGWAILGVINPFKKFSAAVQCGIGLVGATVSTVAGCVGSAQQTLGLSCVPNGALNYGGAIADCTSRVLPWGALLSCGSAIGTSFVNCACAATPLFTSQDQELLDLFLQELSIRRDIALLVYGSPVWTDLVSFDTGDPTAEIEALAAILASVRAFSTLGSDGDLRITAGESAFLSSLPRPMGLLQSDIDALVLYNNATVNMWEMDIFTHAEAGRAGFCDADALLALTDSHELVISQVAAMGAHHMSIGDVLLNAVEDLTDELGVEDTSGVPRYFVLEDETNGTTLRGRVSDGDRLPIASIAPEAYHRLRLVDPTTLNRGFVAFTSEPAGFVTTIPEALLLPTDHLADSDGDRVPDDVEFVVGTLPDIADTDDDGIDDGTELELGLNPLDGLPVATGIIAAADTPSDALRVRAFDDLAAVAHGASGISLFNVFNGMPPVVVAQVDTPGFAHSVDLAGSNLVAADGGGGVAILDISDAAAPSIRLQLPASTFGSGAVQSVVVAGGLAYVGTSAGDIASIELESGTIVDALTINEGIHDLAVDGRWLYASTASMLRTFPLGSFPFDQVAQVSAPVSPIFPASLRRIFVGGDLAYLAHAGGYNIFDVFDPNAPTLIVDAVDGQAGWTAIARNGSGSMLAATGAMLGAPRDISLFDTANPAALGSFQASFATPGDATDVAIYNGQAFVADGPGGLQLANYLAYDALATPPTVSFAVDPGTPVLTEGSLALVSVDVTDDVQVRNVELLQDGAVVSVDGNFPFQFFVTVPPFESGGLNQFQLAVRASDTGGNEAVAAAQTFDIAEDTTSPTVISTEPGEASNVAPGFFDVFAMTVTFDEPLEPTTVTTATIELVAAGLDGVFDTLDDQLVPFTHTLISNNQRLAIAPASPLAISPHRVTISGSVTDVPGNFLDGDGDLIGGDAFCVEFNIDDQISVFWDGGGDGFSWLDPLNWSSDVLPGPGDVVSIPTPGTQVAITGTAPAVSEVRAPEATLRVQNFAGSTTFSMLNGSDIGALHLEGIPPHGANVDVTFGAGTHRVDDLVVADVTISQLNIEGTLQVNRSLDASYFMNTNGAGELVLSAGCSGQLPAGNFVNWGCDSTIHGHLTALGALNATAGSTLTIAESGELTLAPTAFSSHFTGHSLVNRGRITCPAGLGVLQTTSLDNSGWIGTDSGASMQISGSMTHSGSLNIASNSDVLLNVTNTFTGTPTSTIENEGTLTLQSNGTMTGSLTGSGVFQISGGALYFGAGSFQPSGSVIHTNGELGLANSFSGTYSGPQSGSLVINAPVTLSDVQLTSSTLKGLGPLTITNSMSMTNGGTLLAEVVIAQGAHFSNSGSGGSFHNHITVAGTADITTSFVQANFTQPAITPKFTIAPTGVCTLQNGASLGQVNQFDTILEVFGTLRSTDSNAETVVFSDLTCTGSIEVMDGTLNVRKFVPFVGVGTWTQSGTIRVSAGATFNSVESHLVLSGGSTLAVELESTSSFGQVTSLLGGSLTLGGTLSIAPTPSFTTSSGETFDVATYTFGSGVFGTLEGTDLGGGQSLALSYPSGLVRLTTIP